MQPIRVLNYYVNPSYLVLGAIEFGVLMLAAWSGVWLRFRGDAERFEINMQGALPSFVCFALVLVALTIAMRVYPARFREGQTGMAVRTVVAYFLLGAIALSGINELLPVFFLGHGVLVWALPLALVYVTLLRLLFFSVTDASKLARRVLVLGAGSRAQLLWQRMGGSTGKPGIEITGFVPLPGQPADIPAELQRPCHGDLLGVATALGVTEIVVAVDERRSSEGGSYPLDALLDCKLSGIAVIESVSFLERELEKVEIDLVRPSWLVFSEGFRLSTSRDVVKRLFDLAASLTLLAVAWPFMLLTALAIWLESGLHGPVLYRQQRAGLNGKPFMLVKFRSMRTDAEKDGRAVWASANDDRITRVGRFIRNTRLDELPQLWNVIRGDMSFVGPRPERPEFVRELAAQIPYFDERHRVKPGLAGWAQLCFPYGASVEDAAEKLRYDLYYIKNHSILMDLLILIQTVEVVLVGGGAR